MIIITYPSKIDEKVRFNVNKICLFSIYETIVIMISMVHYNREDNYLSGLVKDV